MRGLDDLEDFRRILGDDRLSTLMKMLQQVNPGKGGTDQDRDVIDI